MNLAALRRISDKIASSEVQDDERDTVLVLGFVLRVLLANNFYGLQ